MAKVIPAKLGDMPEVQDWVVYPPSRTPSGDVLIQCDTHVCQFNAATGLGVLSTSSPSDFGHFITVPTEVIAAALDAQPKDSD